MTRETSVYLILALIVGVSIWLFRVDKGIKETQQVVVEQETNPTPVRNVATTTSVERIVSVQKEAARSRVQAELNAIQQRLNNERQKLAQQRQAIANLRARAATATEERAPMSSSYASQLEEGNNRLREFAADLQSLNNIESEINRQAASVLRDQSSQQQVLKDQLDENIKAQEELIKQTRDQIEFWRLNPNYTTEQLAQLEANRALLEEQQVQLQNLRQQRLALSNDILANSRAVQLDREQALADLSETRENIRDEMLVLSQTLSRLQEVQSQQRVSQGSLSSQIRQAERAYQQQQEQVQVLESSLNQKNEELNLLTR